MIYSYWNHSLVYNVQIQAMPFQVIDRSFRNMLTTGPVGIDAEPRMYVRTNNR